MLLCSNALFVIPPKRDPVSDPGPILKHRSGPSSQLSGPIARFRACVEDAQRLRLSSAPSPRRGLPVCTGPSSEIQIGKAESEKREKDRKPNAFFRARRGWHSKSYSQFLSSV